MELTGRKSAAVLEVAKESMSKHANGDAVANQPQPAPATRAPLVGAVAGGLTGAGLMGAAAHHANKSLATGAARIPRHLAALGGGTVGAGVGATLGAGYAIRKMMKQPDEAPAKTGAAGPLLHLHAHGAGPRDVAGKMIEYLRTHPRAAAAAGAALLAAPAAGAGYLHEKARHTAGGGGKSEYEIDNDLALAGHQARVEHKGKPPSGVDRLVEKYLLLKAQAGKEGRENPGRAAAYGAIPYGALAGVTGAAVVPRLLRW
jgi:hypothetical protein